MTRPVCSYATALACSLAVAASVAAAPPPALDATVVDPHGRPVPGVGLELAGPLGIACSTTTGTDGRARCEHVADGRYTLVAVAHGFRADPLGVLVHDGTSAPVTLQLIVAALNEAVIVSAAAIDAPRSSLPASTTVIGHADLRASQTTGVGGLLASVPGFTVASNGSAGAVASAFPRGGESDYTLVVVDGIRQNAFGGGVDLAHLDLDTAERVEVTRGPQSALFGADAIGAVVFVTTRRSGPLRIGASADVGSFETTQGSLTASGARGPWSGHASGTYVHGIGANGATTTSGEVVANDDYLRRSFGASLAFDAASTRARLVLQHRNSDRGNPGPFGSDPNGTFAGVDRIARGTTETTGWSASLTQQAGSRWRVRADGSRASLDSGYRSAFGASIMETTRSTGRVQVDGVVAPVLSVSAGVEALDESARSTYITDATFAPVPIERRIVGTFGELRFDGGRRVFAAVGFRAESIERASLPGDASPWTPRPDFVRDRLTSLNPKVALSWIAVPMREGRGAQTRLKVNAGTGIRPPDAFEIAFTDNPSLAPERSRSVDAGIEQLLLGGRVAIEATWFANRYDDLIVAVGPAFANVSRYRTDNIANARSRGLELEATWRSASGLRVRAGYTWLDTAVLAVDAADTAPAPFVVGDPLVRRPRHQGFAELLYARDRGSVFVRTIARGAVLDVDPSYGTFGGTLTAPGWGRTDVGGTVRLARRQRVEAFARVTNLFDRVHEEAFGFPAPRRALVGGLRVDFGR